MSTTWWRRWTENGLDIFERLGNDREQKFKGGKRKEVLMVDQQGTHYHSTAPCMTQHTSTKKIHYQLTVQNIYHQTQRHLIHSIYSPRHLKLSPFSTARALCIAMSGREISLSIYIETPRILPWIHLRLQHYKTCHSWIPKYNSLDADLYGDSDAVPVCFYAHCTARSTTLAAKNDQKLKP